MVGNKLSDPKLVGPGIWWLIHNKAKDAITDGLIEEFIALMNYLADKFPCLACRKHIREYINTHPFNDLRNLVDSDGEKNGMFKWSWLFHNAVNTRINKPYVDWETAVGMFYNSEICNENCDAASDTDTVSDTVIETQKIPEINQMNGNIENNRKNKLVQGYFMSIGIPKTLEKHQKQNQIQNQTQNQTNQLVSFAK